MVSVFDVAAYILNRQGPLTTMKLQKLVYYCQAWSLVWDEERLFKERIEAWANGPVCPALYKAHKGLFQVSRRSLGEGDVRAIRGEAQATVDAILEFYGKQDANWLSQLTHMESPWADARKGLAPGQPSRAEITPAAMAEYYGSL